MKTEKAVATASELELIFFETVQHYFCKNCRRTARFKIEFPLSEPLAYVVCCECGTRVHFEKVHELFRECADENSNSITSKDLIIAIEDLLGTFEEKDVK